MGSNNWALRVLMKKNVDLMGRKNQCRRDGRRFFLGGGGGGTTNYRGPTMLHMFLSSWVVLLLPIVQIRVLWCYEKQSVNAVCTEIVAVYSQNYINNKNTLCLGRSDAS